jgi:hypothetical protein
VSLKSILVVLWACLIAGAAVASERERLCMLQTHANLQRSHDFHRLHQDEYELLIVSEVDVTNK